MSYEVIEHPNDPGLGYKKLNSKTEKIAMFTKSFNVDLDRCVQGARELSSLQLKKKMNLGVPEIDTNICVSYMGKLFNVNSSMSMDEAKEGYQKQVRQDRTKKLGLKLVP